MSELGIPKRRIDERQPRAEDLSQHGPVDVFTFGAADIPQVATGADERASFRPDSSGHRAWRTLWLGTCGHRVLKEPLLDGLDWIVGLEFRAQVGDLSRVGGVVDEPADRLTNGRWLGALGAQVDAEVVVADPGVDVVLALALACTGDRDTVQERSEVAAEASARDEHVDVREQVVVVDE